MQLLSVISNQQPIFRILNGLIFRCPGGQPIPAKADDRAWLKLLTRANADVKVLGGLLTVHSARHTTATLLMELGVDQKIIGEIVGHASVRTTHRYQHVSSAVARDAMERIGAHFGVALTPNSDI